jgi:hypothetical protein
VTYGDRSAAVDQTWLRISNKRLEPLDYVTDDFTDVQDDLMREKNKKKRSKLSRAIWSCRDERMSCPAVDIT